MDRSDYVLGVMAAAQGALTPVQVQKLFFILDQKLAAVLHGPHFHFVPYNYGPFDAAVYHELDRLQQRGLATMDKNGATRAYSLSPIGFIAGLSVYSKFPPPTQDYIRQLITWIRSLSFAQLVFAVYQEWPSMKANSVFKG